MLCLTEPYHGAFNLCHESYVSIFTWAKKEENITSNQVTIYVYIPIDTLLEVKTHDKCGEVLNSKPVFVCFNRLLSIESSAMLTWLWIWTENKLTHYSSQMDTCYQCTLTILLIKKKQILSSQLLTFVLMLHAALGIFSDGRKSNMHFFSINHRMANLNDASEKISTEISRRCADGM